MKQNDKWGLLSEIFPFLYWFLLYMVSCLPHRIAFQTANQIGRLRYKRSRSRVQLHNGLTSVLSPEQVENSLLRVFQHAASSDLEYWFYLHLSKENIARFVQVQGLENLNQALEHGKGVILYSGHLYSQLTFFSALGLMGYKMNVVAEPHGRQSSWIERWCRYERPYTIMEQQLGCRMLYVGANVAMRASRALKRNEVVLILVDKPTVYRSIEVDFLNNRTRFPVGPVMLAQKTGAPLLDFYVHCSEESGPALGKIGVPFHASANINSCAQHCATRLEDSIRKHPLAWTQFWHFTDYSSPWANRDQRLEKRI